MAEAINNNGSNQWFDKEPELVLKRLVPFEAHWPCPNEGCEGEMKFNGRTVLTDPTGYHHTCDKCGFTAAIHDTYPRIIHKPSFPTMKVT